MNSLVVAAVKPTVGGLGALPNLTRSTTYFEDATENQLNVTLSSTPILDASPTTYLWLEELSVGPDWDEAQDLLGWTWMLHIYGFACLFFMLAFYTFFSILNLRAQLSSRPFMSTINVFLCLLGVSRAASFLIDPYNSKEIMPGAIGAILWELGFPCLLSAFGLIQLAFLQLTQLRIGPAKLRSKSCLSLIISAHFFFTISSSILWTFNKGLKVLCYLNQAAFACWGTFLCTTFLYGGWRTMKLLKLIPPILFPHMDPNSSYENKGILQLGILAKCNNLASVAATVAAPALLGTPKILISDEDDKSSKTEVSQVPNSKANSDSKDEETMPIADKSAESKSTSSAEEREAESLVKEQKDDTDKETGNATTATSERSQRKIGQRVRISSVPKILQNGSIFTMDSVGRRDEDDQVELGLLDSNKSRKRADHAKCQDMTLSSILNHIAFVDQAMDDFKFDSRRLKPTRRSQIQKVLHITYLTAFLGLFICVLRLFTIFGPYGIASLYGQPSPIPWFIFQTISRTAEFLMAVLMANITKQPVNRHHFPYSCHLHNRENFYY